MFDKGRGGAVLAAAGTFARNHPLVIGVVLLLAIFCVTQMRAAAADEAYRNSP